MLALPRYSFGVGDRFAHEAEAQLVAFERLALEGVLVAPVWNKSNREHVLIGSQPASVREAADRAVAALKWPHLWFVDADHIRLDTVERFLESSNFFTIDVADSIGQPASDALVDEFVARHGELSTRLLIAGIEEPLALSPSSLKEIVRTYLLAAKEAGTLYRHISKKRGGATFITEVSMDETAAPQTPPELLVILALLADEYGGIDRGGNAGSFTYTVKSGMSKKPVGYVTFESCLRYINWLTNGPSSTETEKGTYDLKSGTIKLPNHGELAKGETVTWVMPTENEWYKAAYYDPKKSGGAGYWQYPGKGYTAPAANINSNTPTDGGSNTAALTAYGTYDQGGNQWEYNESRFDDKVGLRGGSWYINDNEGYMDAFTRYDVYSAKWPHYGFRVAALGGK